MFGGMICFSPGEKAAGVGVVKPGAFSLVPHLQLGPGHRFLILGLYLQHCQRASGAVGTLSGASH